jgi:hypothetical protein
MHQELQNHPSISESNVEFWGDWRKWILLQSIFCSQNLSNLLNHDERSGKLPSYPVASPVTAHFETKRSSREAERWREDEQSEDEHHLSASLPQRVEEGGATSEPQHRSVLAFRLSHLFLNRNIWPRNRSQLTSFFLDLLASASHARQNFFETRRLIVAISIDDNSEESATRSDF